MGGVIGKREKIAKERSEERIRGKGKEKRREEKKEVMVQKMRDKRKVERVRYRRTSACLTLTLPAVWEPLQPRAPKAQARDHQTAEEDSLLR